MPSTSPRSPTRGYYDLHTIAASSRPKSAYLPLIQISCQKININEASLREAQFLFPSLEASTLLFSLEAYETSQSSLVKTRFASSNSRGSPAFRSSIQSSLYFSAWSLHSFLHPRRLWRILMCSNKMGSRINRFRRTWQSMVVTVRFAHA